MGNALHLKPTVLVPQIEFVGKIVSFDFLIFHRLYLRTVNNLQGEYSSFLSILSMSEAGCISTFLPYWLHHNEFCLKGLDYLPNSFITKRSINRNTYKKSGAQTKLHKQTSNCIELFANTMHSGHDTRGQNYPEYKKEISVLKRV